MIFNKPKKAMVLGAGIGRRLHPYTDNVPKLLLPVAGQPLIDWVFDHLEQSKIEEVVINLPPKSEQVQEHLAKRLYPKIHFLVEDELLGTGGAIKNAMPILGRDPFFVLHSNIIWINKGSTVFRRLTNYFNKDKMDILALTVDKARVPWFKGKGDFLIEDSNHRMKRVTHGMDSPVLNAGIYLMQPHIFDDMPDGAYPLTTVLDKVAQHERLYGLPHNGDWFGVTTADDYAAVNHLLSDQ